MAETSNRQIHSPPAARHVPSHKNDSESSSHQQIHSPDLNVTSDFQQTGLTPATIIHLQRMIGNQAVGQMLDKQKQSSKSIQRLPDQLEGSMATIFGANLSEVNVHTDAGADYIARDAKADATTVDNNIYFKEGAYRPGTSKGNALIAREVAHIQRSELTGSHANSSTKSDASAKQDAENVSELVEIMGPNPSQVLQPIDKNPSLIQKRLLQREGYSHSRVAGIVTSKVVQGIFTTVLGPVGLIWRYPLIQKNLGEITGWEQFGTRKGKKDKEGKLVDKMRYGNTPLGTAMRWMAGISEVLKEFTIWLGFGSFIAAIVTAATHGAAAPVFLGLSIATAITAGLHFALRSILVALNGYRLWRAEKDGKTEKLPFIKHQMVSDGVEGIGAALGAIFGALGAGGVTSAGSALAGAAGHAGSGASADPAAKLAAFGLGAATQGLGTTVATNTGKEIGKDAVKPDNATTGFIGHGSKTKDDWGGFGKDAVEIKNSIKHRPRFKIGKSTKKEAAASSAQQLPTTAQSADGQLVKEQAVDISAAANLNSGIQSAQSNEARSQDELVGQLAPKANKTADDVGSIQQNMVETQTKAEEVKENMDNLVTESDPDKLDDLKKQVDTALAKDNEPPTSSASTEAPTNPTQTEKKVDLSRADIQREGGVSGWFASKLSSVKSGVNRLNNKILKGVMKFASKFNKMEGDRKSVATTMSEEKSYTAKEVKAEQVNDELFAEFQGKAGQLDQGVDALTEMENQ